MARHNNDALLGVAVDIVSAAVTSELLALAQQSGYDLVSVRFQMQKSGPDTPI
jgi:hypothetical protein